MLLYIMLSVIILLLTISKISKRRTIPKSEIEVESTSAISINPVITDVAEKDDLIPDFLPLEHVERKMRVSSFSSNVTKRERKLTKQQREEEKKKVSLQSLQSLASISSKGEKREMKSQESKNKFEKPYILDWMTKSVIKHSPDWLANLPGLVGIKLTQDQIHFYTEKFQYMLLDRGVSSKLVDSILHMEYEEKKEYHYISDFVQQIKQKLIREITIPIPGSHSSDNNHSSHSIDGISVDMIDAITKKESPFSILLCGPNGVGKTTTIAKLVQLLNTVFPERKISVVACDTFRSGAIEQLETHSEKLGFHIHKGEYSTDPIKVFKRSLSYPADIRIIDTAGRMHTNRTLMNSLKNLIQTSQPDWVCYVSEAIAGISSVEQIREFNEVTMTALNRPLSAMILTKYDTVDNKIGTLVNLLHSSHVPIAYVGIGQQYTDLRMLTQQNLINDLLNV